MAVLTLDRNVRYAPHISPICLPEAGKDPDPGTNAYVPSFLFLAKSRGLFDKRKTLQSQFLALPVFFYRVVHHGVVDIKSKVAFEY